MAKRLILSGNVQGVFCRDYSSKNAKKLGLKGSASNLEDGTVEILIDSDNKTQIDYYINALRENPFRLRFHGQITHIDVSDYHGSISGDYEF